MIMPKKTIYKGNPRKFTDKIALIKQKEALSNASFQSAIHGLTEFTMNRQPGKEIENLEVKDNYSSNSYSPESFTSESTALSYKTVNPLATDRSVENFTVNHNNDVFNSCHELSQSKEACQSQPNYDQVKYRHSSDRRYLQSQSERYSNIEEYYPNNKNLSRLYEPVSSGSLPDVSNWRNPSDVLVRQSYENKHFRDSVNSDHIDLQESLSHLEHVKLGKKSKAALLEHLKNRGMQNPQSHHPHHIQSSKDPVNIIIPALISSPSLHRAAGIGHEHSDSDCTGNSNESGHLKHFSVKNSPYVSFSHRDRHNAKEPDDAGRQRYYSGLANQPMKHLKLNINSGDNFEDFGSRNKALTPTGQVSNSWFNCTKNDNNVSLLHPSMFSNVLANENGRRVASDSNIQNSLKNQNDRLSQATNFNDSTFERVNSLKREQLIHPYQRNQSLTSYQTQNTQNTYDSVSQSTDFQREISQLSVSSSFLDNLLALKSPDENLDPSLASDVNIFKTPDISQRQVFVFNEFADLPKDDVPRNVVVSQFIENQDYSHADNSENYMDSSDKDIDTINSLDCEDITENKDNFDNSNQSSNSHDCYWVHSNESNSSYTKELSPTIRPCENLDPKDVIVDIYTDFAGIPDITISDVDAQRRDSLKWTDEVLGNLTSDPSITDNGQSRDRSMSVYQPMVALTEEDRVPTDGNDF